MGNCLRPSADPSDSRSRSRTRGSSRRVGKNQALKKNRIKWYSEIGLTTHQVMSKREEFWDTAPAFEGRREIWDALRAAAEALEKADYELAQAIVDGANIIVPTGLLYECYDELGNRYQLPPYVLSLPHNVIREDCDSTPSPPPAPLPEAGDHVKPHRSFSKNSAEPVGATLGPLVLRLSTGQEFTVTFHANQTVRQAKHQLARICGFRADRQRWYCYGQMFPDMFRLDQCSLPHGFVIQVVVHWPDDDPIKGPQPDIQVTS